VAPTPTPQGQFPAGPSRHGPLQGAPVAPKRGLSLGSFFGILLGIAALGLALGLSLMTVLFIRERNRAEASARSVATRAPQEEGPPARGPEGRPDLPTVTRHVPNHSLRLLEGCTDENLATLSRAISDAIDQGAPEYNEGKFVECYRVYVGAALELERGLPKTCSGPTHALENGRHAASGLEHPSEQAWAMRDAFDGLLDVIGRSRQAGGASL
jgi:serine protease Do